MLEHEITPFAEAHREVLDEIISAMMLQNTPDPTKLTFPTETVFGWVEKLNNTKRAFDRFEVCALDEWKQKKRYRKYAKEHGYPYS